MSRLTFQLQGEASGSAARAASFHTLHGTVNTPVFMPVGTQATVKSQTVEMLQQAGSSVLLANTYHLMLRPGREVFEKLGGLHRFMNWKGPILTDSGGFQIFSLPHSRAMKEEGATFQSYVDGQMHLLSPESSIQMQRALGSDIMMVLDQCIPSTAGHSEAKAAMELTHRWARRSLAARGESAQSVFGIVQGACFRDLRRESADTLTQMEFDGFAIGGLAVGEGKSEREDFTESTAALLPRNLPRYLMGVGTPLDILEAVHRGVDMFDCILPSALAQRGVAFTSVGKLQLRRTVYKFSEEPLDPHCGCNACTNYSRAYLHHLYKAQEVLGWTLLAQHNIVFYHRLMREMRAAILDGTFKTFYASQRQELARADDDYPVTPPIRKPKPAVRVLRLGDYEIQSSDRGYSSIRQTSSGEVMGSVSDPTEEANRLYIAQAQLPMRIRAALKSSVPLVIWDVGLGAASNAMAAVRCFEENCVGAASGAPILKIISFENDLDPLRLSLKHSKYFPHLHHSAPHALLTRSQWSSKDGLLEWNLRLGDFWSTLHEAEAPDFIFYDLFSAKSEMTHWQPKAFANLFEKCRHRQAQLFTYSNSTAVRAALLSAGFYVAPGVGTGPKQETTRGFSMRPEGVATLGAEWLARWEKSGAKFPKSLGPDQYAAFERSIREHPQFSS